MKVVLRYKKRGYARFLSSLETIRAIERNLRRAEVDLVFSRGFHPTPKISYLDSMATGVVNLALYFSVEVSRWESSIFSRLKDTALNGLEPVDQWCLDVDINSIVDAYEFELIIENDALISEISEDIPIEKGRKKKVYRFGDLVSSFRVMRLKKFTVLEYTLERKKLFSPWNLIRKVGRVGGIFIPICKEALSRGRSLSSLLNEWRDGNGETGDVGGRFGCSQEDNRVQSQEERL